MKRYKMIIVVLGLVGFLLGPSWEAWAKGGPGGTAAQCLLFDPVTQKAIKPGAAKKFTATIAVDVTDGTQSTGTQTLDYTIRADRLNQTSFFRTNLVTPISGFTNENLVCLVLNPDEISDVGAVHDAVLALHQAMLNALSLTDSPYFCITDNSIQQTEAEDVDKTVPNTLHAMSLADVLIYARTKPCNQQ